MKKLFTFVLAIALFLTCIPTGWAAKPEAPKTLTAYRLYQYGSGGKDCLAIASDKVNTKGALVYRTKMAATGERNQQIVLTSAGNGWYYIHWLGYSGIHEGRDFVLDQRADGVVTQYTRVANHDNQLWKLVKDGSKVGNVYRLQNKKSGLYLTFDQASNGYIVSKYQANSKQLFEFYPADASVPNFLKSSSTSSSSGNSSGSSAAKQADKIVNVAMAQKGKTGAQFGWYTDWCTYFVCWAGRNAAADFPKSNLPWPPSVVSWFVSNNKGTFFCFRNENLADLAQPREHQEYRLGAEDLKKVICGSQSAITPRKGDLICFRWSNAGAHNWSHIGIVTDVRDGYIYTVEGNSAGRVATQQYAYPNNAQIVGLIRPNYK